MRTLILVALLCLAAAAEEKPLWLAVGPEPLLAPLEPLAEHRRAQGIEALVVPGSVADALRTAPRPPRWLLLVGDEQREGAGGDWRLPARYPELYRWRDVQPATYACDAVQGDLDGDGTLDCAVGRIPARTPEQVAAVVRKTIAYEKAAPTTADLRLLVWAGASGYGAMMDRMTTGTLLLTVNRYAPRWAGRWLIAGDAQSPFCGWPPEQPRLFSDEMRRGALLSAIIAHASADATLSMRHDNQWIGFHIEHAQRYLAEGDPVAPMVLLACNCGEFDRPEPALAEVLLFLPGGPAAVVGATTESHPLPNFFSGVCLLKALAGEYDVGPRFGDLWRAAQAHARVERDPLMESMLKDVEGKLEERIDVEKLRRDQERLYALFGDPALKLRLPEPLQATVEKTEAGWRWSVERPDGSERLHIGYREATPAIAQGAKERDEKAKLFRTANAAGDFEQTAILTNEPWTGTATRPGHLRLLATGPNLWRCTLLPLE